MNITQLVQMAQATGMLDNVAKKQGLSPDLLSQVLSLAGPEILSQLGKNLQDPDKFQSLSQALDDDRHNGSVLDNMSDFLQNNDGVDGGKILGHIFGNQQKQVEEKVARQSGVDLSKIAPIMAILAPLIMSYLGKQKRQNKPKDSSDLGGLINTFLDKNNNGSIVDDLAGMALNNMFGKKS